MTDIESGPKYAARLPNELVENCRVLPDRACILPLIPKGLAFCEVGVALGDFSSEILNVCEPSSFYAIDLFGLHHAPQMWNGRVGRELNGKKHVDFFTERFGAEIDAGIVRVISGDSSDGLRRLPDSGIDVFYIDANHSYKAVKQELNIIKSKIRPDGFIILNDYIMADWVTNTPYGVIQAVHEFMISERWEMIHLALQTGMFCDVTIRQKQLGS